MRSWQVKSTGRALVRRVRDVQRELEVTNVSITIKRGRCGSFVYLCTVLSHGAPKVGNGSARDMRSEVPDALATLHTLPERHSGKPFQKALRSSIVHRSPDSFPQHPKCLSEQVRKVAIASCSCSRELKGGT